MRPSRARRRIVAMIAVAACTLAAATACRTGPVFPEGRIPAGSWGGEHVLLTVTDTGATLEFDCAAGAIPGPLLVNDEGAFDWAGTYTVGHGGPVRQDEVPDVRDATYRGTTDGRDMRLHIVVSGGTIPPLDFTLERGRTAHVFKCL